MLNRLRAKLQAGEITFGLREAVVLAIAGIALGIAAALHYAGQSPSGAEPVPGRAAAGQADVHRELP